MLPGVNPRQMQQMMKKMGIKQEEIQAYSVIIKTEQGDLVIENPGVTKVNMMGQESFQVTGTATLVKTELEINDEDIQMVADQAGVDFDVAKETLEECRGDLAEAITRLQNSPAM